MKELRNSIDSDARFESLEEAKTYYYPEMDALEIRESYTGDDFESYLHEWESYKKGISSAKTLEDLAYVLNEYTDVFGNGSSWQVVEF